MCQGFYLKNLPLLKRDLTNSSQCISYRFVMIEILHNLRWVQKWLKKIFLEACENDIECLYIFQQQCPTGYFTCQSGSMSCIQESFKCDCSAECDDGSDETESYAGCTNVAQCMLQNGAG